MMENNITKLGRQAPQPFLEPDGIRHDDGRKYQKTRETIPGTLPKTKRIEEMMMEQMPEYPEPIW